MKRWLKYVKPYLSSFILGPLGMIVEVIGEMFMPILLAQLINEANDKTLTVPKCLGIAGALIVIVLLMMAGGVAGAYFGAKASVNFAADLRRDLYAKVQQYSFANIDKFSASSLVTRMTNDVTQIQNFVNMLLRMALRSPGMLIGGIIMAVMLKPSLSVVLAVTIPLMLVVIFVLIRIGFPRFERLQKKVDKLNSTVRENVTNVRVVKSFVREDYEVEKFERDNSDLKNSGMHAVKLMIFMGPHNERLYVYHGYCGYLAWTQNRTWRRYARRRPFRLYYLYNADTFVAYDGHLPLYDVLKSARVS